jgi:copper transport protein
VQAVPARTALEPQLYTTDVAAGEGANAMVVNITVDPARTGVNGVHLYAYTPEGLDLPVRDMTADFFPPGQNTGGIKVNLQRGGENHFTTSDVVIPTPGDWKLVIHVLRGEFGDTPVVTDVPIR